MLKIINGPLERLSYRWEYTDERALRAREWAHAGALNAAYRLLRHLGLGVGPYFAATGMPWSVGRRCVLRVNGQAMQGSFQRPEGAHRPEPFAEVRVRMQLLAARGETVRAVVEAGAPGEPWVLHALLLPERRCVQLFGDLEQAGRWGTMRYLAKVLLWIGLALLVVVTPVIGLSYLAGGEGWRVFWQDFGGFSLVMLVSMAFVWLICVRASWPAVLKTEAVFAALGWPDVRRLDLDRLDRRHRPTADPLNLALARCFYLPSDFVHRVPAP